MSELLKLKHPVKTALTALREKTLCQYHLGLTCSRLRGHNKDLLIIVFRIWRTSACLESVCVLRCLLVCVCVCCTSLSGGHRQRGNLTSITGFLSQKHILCVTTRKTMAGETVGGSLHSLADAGDVLLWVLHRKEWGSRASTWQSCLWTEQWNSTASWLYFRRTNMDLTIWKSESFPLNPGSADGITFVSKILWYGPLNDWSISMSSGSKLKSWLFHYCAQLWVWGVSQYFMISVV